MPTYEYACKTCGKEFEVFQSIKADALSTCDCGKGGELRRKIGRGAGIIFKGTGFYETDYKRKADAPAGAEKSDSPAPAKTESSPSSPPAATPAATSSPSSLP